MAAPFVTGAIALWLQADPTLTPAKIRDIFSRTAINNDKYINTNDSIFPNNT